MGQGQIYLEAFGRITALSANWRRNLGIFYRPRTRLGQRQTVVSGR